MPISCPPRPCTAIAGKYQLPYYYRRVRNLQVFRSIGARNPCINSTLGLRSRCTNRTNLAISRLPYSLNQLRAHPDQP
jgi:hypothetical protein